MPSWTICTVKPYILSERALHSSVAMPSFGNIPLAAGSPSNGTSCVLVGISFARFCQNLAKWPANGEFYAVVPVARLRPSSNGVAILIRRRQRIVHAMTYRPNTLPRGYRASEPLGSLCCRPDLRPFLLPLGLGLFRFPSFDAQSWGRLTDPELDQ